MIRYLRTSLFHSPAQTLVNTVNTIGVMGKGVAKEFKSRYPKMFTEYKHLCDRNELKVGTLHLWRSDAHWVLNFPTKTTWQQPSKVSYVEAGLKKFVETYSDLGISSASFPPLGCGNGGLLWEEVRPMMEWYLQKVTIPIYIHNIQVPKSFTPEHKIALAPNDYDFFWSDLEEIVLSKKDGFTTSTGRKFWLLPTDKGGLIVRFQEGEAKKINDETIKEAYVRLRDSILVEDTFASHGEQRLRSYLFPAISALPYVSKATVSRRDSSSSESLALYLDRNSRGDTVDISSGSQGCLFQ